MRNSTLCRWATILALAATGCGERPTGPYPAERFPEPTEFFILSGDQQTGKAGERLALPLAVAATDAAGNPGQHVRVDWEVASGGGSFRIGHELNPELTSVLSTSTWTDGTSEAVFVPTALGASSVTASATTSEGAALGSVTFTATAADTIVITIGHAGVQQDWDVPWPRGPLDVTVPIGTAIQWSVLTTSDLPGQVVSTEVPPGGTSFSSQSLDNGDRFTFVPDASGMWEWKWDNNDWGWVDNVATLTVR